MGSRSSVRIRPIETSGFGNVSLRDEHGIRSTRSGDTHDRIARQCLRDLAVVGNTSQWRVFPSLLRGPRLQSLHGHARERGERIGFDADTYTTCQAGDTATPSLQHSFKNPWSGPWVGRLSSAKIVNGRLTWLVEHVWVYGNSTNFRPDRSGEPDEGLRSKADPGFGACRLWLPDGAACKGSRLRRRRPRRHRALPYENGVLTNQPLWDPSTGAFLGAGAIVPGVNDVPGASLFDIANRLNVNRNGCAFPASYAATAQAAGARASADTRSPLDRRTGRGAARETRRRARRIGASRQAASED